MGGIRWKLLQRKGDAVTAKTVKQCATAAVDGDSLGVLCHLDYYYFFFPSSYVRENMWSNTFRVSEEMWDPKAAEITSFYQTVQM